MIKNKISKLRVLTRLCYLIIFIFGLLSKKIVFVFITASAILLGPIFCGWMCFVGFYQDILRFIGRFIKKEPVRVDEKVQKFLRFFRYVFLVGALTLGGLFLFPGEVWHKGAQILHGKVVIDAAFYALVILGFISLFTERFFCKYFCTFGAKLGLYSLLRPVTINRAQTCVSCKICDNKCPMQIEVSKINSLANPNCIDCFSCVESCPTKSLRLGFRNYLKP